MRIEPKGLRAVTVAAKRAEHTRSGRFAVLVAAGILLQPAGRPRPAAGVLALLRARRRRPTRSSRRSAFRTSCRICSARARCRRRSFLCTPRFSRAAAQKEADRVAGAIASLLALAVSVIGARRRDRDAAAHRRHRARASPAPRASSPIVDRPHSLSGRRVAGHVGLVPRDAEQPPALLRLVCGAGRVERRHDRDARGVRQPDGSASPGDDAGVGIGRRQRC